MPSWSLAFPENTNTLFFTKLTNRMRSLIFILSVLFVPFCQFAFADAEATFLKSIQPLLNSRCVKCHGEKSPEGNVKLTKYLADPHLWYRVLDQLEHGLMPPEDAKPLADSNRKEIVNWIKGELTTSFAEYRQKNGRSQFRRLSRAEYLNTVEDIFGYRPDPAMLPKDGRLEGYNKVSAALPMTTDGAYGYFLIAKDLVDKKLIQRPPKEGDPRFADINRHAAQPSGQSRGHYLDLGDGWFASFNTDDTSGRTRGPAPANPGRYKIRFHTYGYQTDEPLPVGIYAGITHAYPKQISLRDVVMIPPGKPAVVESKVLNLTKHEGMGILPIPLGIGVQVPKNQQASECKGPGIALQWLEYVAVKPEQSADDWLGANFPEGMIDEIRVRPYVYRNAGKGSYHYSKLPREEFVQIIRKTLLRVAPRILRRDLTEAELDELIAITEQKLDAEERIRTAFLAPIVKMMTKPDFFCVVEEPGQLNDFALASRLSYFLWNSGPDDELLEVARAGKLNEPAELRKQTKRMLKSWKSERFVEDFLEQWLDLHAIDFTSPDKTFYPEYDDILKFSSVVETRETFKKILKENLSVKDFVAPEWMLVNYRLADHYQLPGKFGAKLQTTKVPKGSPFGGLWTQSAVMKVTADGTRTSPVKRGVWMAKRLLGKHISPPPPNVEAIDPDISGAKTLREQLALHSSEGSCATCHRNFDPYGFALESFDVMGNYRTNYRTVYDGSDAEFRSEEVSPETPGHSVDIKANIKGSKELWLVVDPAGSFDWDHGDWIEPKLVGPKGELDLLTLDWKFSTQGWGGQPKRGISAGGQPTTVGGKAVPKTLGTHAPSVIGFDIPEGYDTFVAKGGLDNTATSRNLGKIRFAVYKKRPKLADKVEWMDGLPVDPHGTTPDGQNFDNIHGLRNYLSKHPEQLAWGVTWHMATYATGTPSGPLDREAIADIVNSAKKDNYGLRSLVHGIVQSDLFRWK